jgi:protocatechuate 3,4-dioxygenase beta subunit
MKGRLQHSLLALFAFGVLFGVRTASVAQQARPAPPPARPAASTYRIAGKVVDAHTGATLARCSVQIADTKDRGQPRTTTSNDDGTFSFDGLALGKYALTAERRGCMAQSYEAHDQFSTAIAVGPELDSENLIFKLTAEGIIAGTVTDEAGDPIRGAQVRLFQDEDTTGIRTTRQRQTVMSDDRGVYELAGLRPGAYFLVVTARPWYAQRVRQGLAPSDQEQTSSSTQPLDLAYPTTFYPGVTDQDAASPIPIKGGDRLEANITLAAQPAIRLVVKLPATGDQNNNGVSLMLSQTIFGQTEPFPLQMTGNNGALEIEGVVPGHYDVSLNHFVPGKDQGTSKHFETDVTGATTEISEDGATDDVTVTGKVVSTAGKLPPQAGISLRTPNSRRQQYAQVNEAGDFTLEIPPGTYEVMGNINDMHIAGIKATGTQVTGRMLTVKSGDTPKLEIIAGTGHGEIEGTVTKQDKPASAVMVLLVPEDPKNNEILFRRDQSDSDGTFTLQNIFPGRYQLLAIEDGWELEWANPAVLQGFLSKSVLVEVKAGDKLKKSFEVQSR